MKRRWSWQYLNKFISINSQHPRFKHIIKIRMHDLSRTYTYFSNNFLLDNYVSLQVKVVHTIKTKFIYETIRIATIYLSMVMNKS